MMLCSVIILNWNGRELLRRFLPDVLATTPTDVARVIIADNGSTDGSVEMLGQEFPGVEVMQFSQNYGYAGGYNRAIKAVDTPFVMLLNSDVAPHPGWIEPLIDAMQVQPDVAACQPKVLSVDNPTKFEYAGACGGFLDRHGYPYCRGRVFDTIETDNGQYDTRAEIDWATGAALMVRRDAFLAAGGFDEAFFAHMEEIDLCWRLRIMGYRIEVIPESVVLHLGGGSLEMGSPHKTFLNFRNSLLMLRKNLPRRHLRRRLVVRRLLDALAFFAFLVKGQWRHAVAVVKAHNAYRRMTSKHDCSPDTEPSREVSTEASREVSAEASRKAIAATLASRPDLLTNVYLYRRRTFSSLR